MTANDDKLDDFDDLSDLDELDDLDDDDAGYEDDDDSRTAGLSLDPDSILDHLVPPSIDWRGSVRRYPMASVVSVGLLGYIVGRTKGSTIMTGLTAGLSTALMRQLSDVFEGDFFDF